MALTGRDDQGGVAHGMVPYGMVANGVHVRAMLQQPLHRLGVATSRCVAQAPVLGLLRQIGGSSYRPRPSEAKTEDAGEKRRNLAALAKSNFRNVQGGRLNGTISACLDKKPRGVQRSPAEAGAVEWLACTGRDDQRVPHMRSVNP